VKRRFWCLVKTQYALKVHRYYAQLESVLSTQVRAKGKGSTRYNAVAVDWIKYSKGSIRLCKALLYDQRNGLETRTDSQTNNGRLGMRKNQGCFCLECYMFCVFWTSSPKTGQKNKVYVALWQRKWIEESQPVEYCFKPCKGVLILVDSSSPGRQDKRRGSSPGQKGYNMSLQEGRVTTSLQNSNNNKRALGEDGNDNVFSFPFERTKP
jgi:hypothetical protein